jgi:xanthine dehydrogenase accessory factor
MGIDIKKAITGSRQPTALVTIIDVKGSAPRHPGSKMLLAPFGSPLGTVGGGRGEALALEEARACLTRGASALLTVEMLGTGALESAMICGGVSTMLIERIQDTAPYQRALDLLSAGERVLLLKRYRSLEGAVTVEVDLVDEGGAVVLGSGQGLDPALARKALSGGRLLHVKGPEEGQGLIYDPIFPEEKLLILGAGHVGMALAAQAPRLGFTVTLCDDRRELLAGGKVPEGVRAVLGGYEETIRAFPFDAATYAVIVTRGHQLDLECVRAVLDRPYRYAGFIGSRRKVNVILEQLLADGRDAAQVEALHAPIGLDVAAETPEELAVSILGELVAVRRNAASLPAQRMARLGRRAL